MALVSGGKDSIYSILECQRNGHELVACVHLGAPSSSTASSSEEEEEEESYMYQTAASEALQVLVEECIGVPLLNYQRVGKSVNTSLVYQGDDKGDEVEDLYLALQQAQQQFPGVEAVSSGAILSTYQRVRIEHVCSRLGLTSLSYLWRLGPQTEVLDRMLDDGIVAVVVRAACPPGLIPRRHLNQTLNFLRDSGLLQRLHDRYQFHMCGEGGEYESLVVDSPLYKKKLVLDQVEVIETDEGVGFLRILKCHAEEKGEDDVPILQDFRGQTADEDVSSSSIDTPPEGDDDHHEPSSEAATTTSSHTPIVNVIPHVRHCSGGFLYISEIMAPIAAPGGDNNLSEAERSVVEAQSIFETLRQVLKAYSATSQDVMMVHLYLSEISHFATINVHYKEFFGTLLPPSRSCVAVGRGTLPGGRRVLLDCMVQCGSGNYMRASSANDPILASDPYAQSAYLNNNSQLRQVLHVQSISHWAPVCVGPYSQVNTLRSGLHFLAGQIGLNPATMTLQKGWKHQLEQCWKNVASVLDALHGGSLEHLVSGLIYVGNDIYRQLDAVSQIESISKKMIKENSGVESGRVDAVQDHPYGGYEDEGTWLEMRKEMEDSVQVCPLLLVSIPEMPVGAVVEVEVVAATKDAADCFEMKDVYMSGISLTTKNGRDQSSSSKWDSGHDFPEQHVGVNGGISIDGSARLMGRNSTAFAIVTASVTDATILEASVNLDLHGVFRGMLSTLDRLLADGRSCLTRHSHMSQIRLYYVATHQDSSGESKVVTDGFSIRTALLMALTMTGNSFGTLPAITVVPVQSMKLVAKNPSRERTILAMQAMLLDPVQMDTDMWINKGR